MYREQIERLALDRIGKELSEDAGQLLEEYLSEHPQTKKWANEIVETYQVCSEAVAAEIERVGQVEEQDIARVKHAQYRHVEQRITLRAIYRWAAVLIVGLAVGVITGRWSIEKTVTQTVDNQSAAPLVERQPQGKTEIENADVGTENFWEAKILAARLPRSNYNPREIEQNDSFWPKMREYMNKEKRDD